MEERIQADILMGNLPLAFLLTQKFHMKFDLNLLFQDIHLILYHHLNDLCEHNHEGIRMLHWYY